MTSRVVAVGPEARRDLDSHALWLRDQADPEIAAQFVRAAIRSFGKLAETPGLGPPVPSVNRLLGGLRKWRVDVFPNVLIFYKPVKNGIRIVRILHAAADWRSLLDVN